MSAHLRPVAVFFGSAVLAAAAAGSTTVPVVAQQSGDFPWFWLLVALNALPFALKIPVGIAHTILFIVVLRDRPPTPPRFAPKWVWAASTLISGFVALCAYWMIHHTRPTPISTQRPEHS